MSAYLKFFELEQSPFEGNAQTKVVLGTQALRNALAAIEHGLAEDASRICVNGDRGLGKTSLARALPKLLGEEARVAVVLDPTGDWEAHRTSIAEQFGLDSTGLARARLLEAARDQRLVLVIDDAQSASEEFLDHLDVVLSYRSEDDRPVIQSVLLARLKTEEGVAPPPLVWWLDRIQTLQLEFAPLPRDGVASYIQRHLKRAGWRGERLFTEDAAHAIHGYTAGIPGEVSALCEQLLGEASDRGVDEIDAAFVQAFCEEDVETTDSKEDDEEEETSDEAWNFDGEFDSFESPADSLSIEGNADGFGSPTSSEAPDDEGASVSPDLAAALKATLPAGAAGAAEEASTRVDQAGAAADAAVGPGRDENFAGADAAMADETSVLPLEGFERDEFDGPATPEELRALRGDGMTRLVRYFAGGALAVLVAGLAMVLWSGDEGGAPPPDLSDSLNRTMPKSDSVEPNSPRGTRDARNGRDTRKSSVGFLPGGGFVPVDVLDGAGSRSSGAGTRKSGSTGSRTDQRSRESSGGRRG